MKRLFESNFGAYKIISSPIFYENQKLEYGKPILISDSVLHRPMYRQMPQLKEDGRIQIRRDHNEGPIWPLRKDSLNRYPVPLKLSYDNMILLFLEDSEKKTNSWFWIPYEIKNKPDGEKYWSEGR
jgi:hypothetical protein